MTAAMFPVFQYIMVLIVIAFIIIFSKQIYEGIKAIKQYFRIIKYKKSFSWKVKWSIRRYFEENELMNAVQITQVKVKGKEVIIYSMRPGIVIGKKGAVIEGLKEVLKRDYKIKKVHIKEVNVWN
jgi:ribosomal protein S3